MSFKASVIKQVKKIPRGKVATYGLIAALVGKPRAARAVGQILHNYGDQEVDIPWHRVINSRGFISIDCLEHPAEIQADLLVKDGVRVNNVNKRYRVDLLEYLWLI